jgi:MFS family permease
MRALAPDLRREIEVGGLVAFAHLLSHFYMLVLPPLFPVFRRELGVGYIELGFTITAFSVTTGLLQTPMGFLVNKIGGRKVLIGGLFLNAGTIALAGFVTQYWQLAALMLLSGVGSSVFHPADYSILNARIDVKRLGRALSFHTLGGNLGFVLAPPVMLALTSVFDWRVALFVVGGVGVALAFAMLLLSGVVGEGGKGSRRAEDSWRKLATSPTVMLLFAFYTLSSVANCGIVYFSVVAFKDMYGLTAAAASAALTAYQVMSMLAVLPGGWLADKIEDHELFLAGSFLLSGALLVFAGLNVVAFPVAVAAVGLSGGLRGIVNASRDVSVRHAAKDVSVGTLFAFVTTGFAGGQIVGPTLYGWLLDAGHPRVVLFASAAFSTLAICTMMTGWFRRRSTALAAGE